MRRFLILLFGLSAVSLTFAGIRDAKGTGTISAQGKGVVKFFGTGKIDISGDGILWVVDCSMDNNLNANVTGQGERSDKTPAFIYTYHGFNGQASIKGGPMKLVFTGKGQINATGKGKILLKGAGTYRINDQEIAWPEDVETEITIDESE